MKFAKRADVIIIGAIVVISLAVWGTNLLLSKNEKKHAEIYYQSHLAMTVDLSKGEDRTFSISQNENVVFHLYPDGSICFEHSDCPDKICIRTGRISQPGQIAACLPNEIILKIVGESQSDAPDITVGG